MVLTVCNTSNTRRKHSTNQLLYEGTATQLVKPLTTSILIKLRKTCACRKSAEDKMNESGCRGRDVILLTLGRADCTYRRVLVTKFAEMPSGVSALESSRVFTHSGSLLASYLTCLFVLQACDRKFLQSCCQTKKPSHI